MSLRSAFPRLWQEIRSQFGEVASESVHCPGFQRLSQLPADLAAFCRDSYPRNHTFQLQEDRLVPTPRLLERLVELTPWYPQPLLSFVDLSCSKGYFVFDAASRHHCPRSLGVDIAPESITACQALSGNFLDRESVTFQQTTLPRLADGIETVGGPFQVALLVNTYQYLRLGSEIAPAVADNHRDLFALFARVCSGRLLFHNRLSFDDLQQSVRDRTPPGAARDYSPAAIRAAAEEFFEIEASTGDPVRPLLVLKNRRGMAASRG